MEIQDLNAGVFQNGIGRMRDESARGARSPRDILPGNACALGSAPVTIFISVLFY